MSIEARSAGADLRASARDCAGCGGEKKAPLACLVTVRRGQSDVAISMALCEECGRDFANAVGFMCIKDGGWSKLEPRKKKGAR